MRRLKDFGIACIAVWVLNLLITLILDEVPAVACRTASLAFDPTPSLER
jgi:hypothetical protein